MSRNLYLVCCGIFVYFLGISSVFSQINHQLEVNLNPESHTIQVIDTLTLPESISYSIQFTLHAGLKPKVLDDNIELKLLQIPKSSQSNNQTQLPLEHYQLSFKNKQKLIRIQYGGEIFHDVKNISKDYARSFKETSGIINNEGVFLAGASYWYPVFENELVTFSLNINLPKDWKSVSQGSYKKIVTAKDKSSDTWTIDKPQQEIYLIAAKFYLYQQKSDSIVAQVFLRTEDPALAQKYLDVTSRYITMYNKLLGLYPYNKFALVENFWETGYGMPSFTLLGPKVIRLPFILHSSYPHEILHNWWGNGVYVDYESGNWSEGLTSYLADHLIKEQRGHATAYRRAALQKYTDFVRDKQDFPLTEFRSRHSAVTEAVGYGKTLMLFHMLRQTLGDKNFNRGLKKLYSQQSFKVTSFSDLNKIFSSITKSEKKSSVDSKWIDLMFTQWTQRVGAPKLEISNYKVKIEGDSFRLTALLTQTQAEDVFEIDVPIAVHLEGQDKAFQTEIRMNSRKQNISLKLAAKPLKLEVDPEFDIFRRLDTNEIPPSINQVFGADSVLIVLPAKAPKKIREAYMKLAKSWQVRQQSKIKISYDKDITSLPKDRAVWLLGWENEFRDYLNTTLDVYPYSTNQDNIKIVEENFTKQDFSVVVVSRHQDSNKFAFSWLATNNIKALPGLGRKLPHYGKYSYLAFMGDEPVIKFKGQWPVVNSPMTVVLTDKKLIKSGVLKKRTALATLPPAFSQNRILKDIRILSDSKFTGRGLGTSGLDQAAHYIQKQFKDAGLLPGQFQDEKKSTRYFQQWQTSISEKPETKKLQNVIGIIPGSDPDLKAESLVIGAHYDHLGLGWPDVHKGDEGKIHHGANDNASGVAVMLELARLLKKGPAPKRSIIFVAFTGEEAGRLGSEYYLKHSGNYPVNKMIAMINLDTVGRLEQKPLIVFGNNTAREWVHIFRGVSYVTGVDIKPVDNDPAASDHTSFIEAGVPAIHLFTGVNLDYHRPTDTINKIDGTGLIKVATVLKETIDYLAERTEFLNSNLTRAGQSNKNKSKSKTMKRRVSLGTVPDFQYSGKGVRIDAVTAGSPAELAQLQKGDIVVQMNKVEILNLRDFSDILRKLKPGDNIDISVLRAGKIHKVSTHVVAR